MGHRSPAYVIARLRQMAYERRNPHAPWWTPAATELVDRWLTRNDVVVEFGSGRSTHWLAKRAARVVSVEHHQEWFQKVRGDLASVTNAEVRLAPDEAGPYVATAEDVPNPTFIVVDGRHRDACTRWAMSRLRPGNAILLDDSHRYLDDAGPHTRKSVPASVERTPLWEELLPELRAWRRLTYSDGVTDTTLLVKP